MSSEKCISHKDIRTVLRNTHSQMKYSTWWSMKTGSRPFCLVQHFVCVFCILLQPCSRIYKISCLCACMRFLVCPWPCAFPSPVTHRIFCLLLAEVLRGRFTASSGSSVKRSQGSSPPPYTLCPNTQPSSLHFAVGMNGVGYRRGDRAGKSEKVTESIMWYDTVHCIMADLQIYSNAAHNRKQTASGLPLPPSL